VKDYPLEFPMAVGKTKLLSTEDVWAWKKAYQAVDVDAELLRISEWLKVNPRKQNNTINGLRRRISTWLSKEQHYGVQFRKKPQGFAEPYWTEENRDQVEESSWVTAHNEGQRVFDAAKKKEKGKKPVLTDKEWDEYLQDLAKAEGVKYEKGSDLKARIAALKEDL